MSDSDVILNRQILSSFLPNPQAVRAFEKIIAVTGIEFPEAAELLDVLTQTSASASEMRAIANRLRQEIEELRLEIAALRLQRTKVFDEQNLIPTRISIQTQASEYIPPQIRTIQQQEIISQRIPTIHALERRVSDLEILLGA